MYKYVIIAAIVACIAIIITLIKAPPHTSTYSNQIMQLRTADIKSDVQAALSKGDHRFVGIMEDGLSVPGVPANMLPISEEMVRVIPNTSDAIESQEHLLLQKAARAYAEAYNQELLAKRANR